MASTEISLVMVWWELEKAHHLRGHWRINLLDGGRDGEEGGVGTTFPTSSWSKHLSAGPRLACVALGRKWWVGRRCR